MFKNSVVDAMTLQKLHISGIVITEQTVFTRLVILQTVLTALKAFPLLMKAHHGV